MKYLRPDAVAEPLVARWYAWPHLISPMTACLNMAVRHIGIMESFLAAPEVHAAAVQDPQLAGGPFMDHAIEHVDQIQALLEFTRSRCHPQLEAAAGVRELDALLAAQADGGPLEPLYPRVPPCLRGLVELVYDTNHQPGVNYLEPLIYRSALYDESLQELALWRLRSDKRKFVLSTPRLPHEAACMLRVPLRSATLDRLFAMERWAGPGAQLIDELTDDADTAAALSRLLTDHAPPMPRAFAGPGTRVRYFGHACVCLETEHTSVLVDPVVSYCSGSSLKRFTFADLPDRLDFVILTHNHQDHTFIETMLRLRHKVGAVLVPKNTTGALEDPGMRQMLLQLGFPCVIELEALEEVRVPGGVIVPIPSLGENSDLRVNAKAGFIVRLGAWSALFAADARNIEPALYRRVFRHLGGVKHVFLGMECDGAPLSWLYGPLLSRPLGHHQDTQRSLSGSDCAMGRELVRLSGAERVSIYAMGQEPWLNHIMNLRYTPDSLPITESDRLIRACRADGINAERLFAQLEFFA